MSRCNYLVPRLFGPGVPVEECGGECLLKEGHAEEHLVKTPAGYYLWIPQDDFCWDDEENKACECDFIECYVYQQIPDAQAKKILAKDGAGTD